MTDNLDERQVKVFGIILDMFWKSVFSLVVLLVFIATSVILLVIPSWPLVAGEGVVGTCLVIVFKHYFPSK